MFSGKSIDIKRISYVTAGGIILIEFLLSATLLPYGIFYTELVKFGATTVTGGLWIPVILVSIRILSNPLMRKICEYFSDEEYDNHRQVITISCLTITIAIILGAISRSTLIQTLTYGLFCGICSSLISNQLKEATYEDFQSKPLLFEGLQQIAKALSLFFMPHVFYYFISNYGIYEAEFIFAALLLHIIPASMLVKSKQRYPNPNLSRYKTLPTLYNINRETTPVPTLPHFISKPKADKEDNSCSEDSSSCDEDEFVVKDLQAASDTQAVVTTVIPVCYKNLMGVDILPEIPEEDEIEDEEIVEKSETTQQETMKDSIRRFSQLSSKFEDLISNEIKNNRGYHNVSVDLENSAQKFTEHRIVVKSNRSSIKCGCCSPYQKYLFKRRVNKMIDCFCDHLLKPLWKALKIIMFYPCLITKVLITITPVIYIVFIPYATTLAEEKYSAQTVSTERTMLLSLIAFPWLCFLVFLPWFINSSKTKLKTIFCTGLIILGISTFLINLRMNYDVIATASLLFGISYGSVELSQDIVFREVAGLQNWRKFRDPLDVVSAILTISSYGVISICDGNIVKFLGASTAISTLLASIWLFIFFKDKLRFDFIIIGCE